MSKRKYKKEKLIDYFEDAKKDFPESRIDPSLMEEVRKESPFWRMIKDKKI